MLKLSTDDFFISTENYVITEPRQPQDPFPEHCHDFNELIIVTSGHGAHIINDVPYHVSSNEVFFIESSDYHLFEDVEHLNLINILYRPEFISKMLSQYLPKGAKGQQWQINSQTISKIMPNIQQLHQESHQSDHSAQLMAQALFQQIIISIWRGRINVELTENTSMDDKLILIIKQLKENIQEHIELPEIAAQYQIPLRTLHRKFKQLTGFSPTQYQHKIRINYALQQLIKTDHSITEIALSSGYDDSNYFSTKFKQFIGVSPSDYRNR